MITGARRHQHWH